MKQIYSMIKHFIIILFAVVLLLILFNIISLVILLNHSILSYQQSYSPDKIISLSETNLTKNNNGSYKLSKQLQKIYDSEHLWAMLINPSGSVIWNSNLPDKIPREYNITSISRFSRAYLKDYPVFCGNVGQNLLVIGYPKSSYFKLTSNYWNVKLLKDIPIRLLVMLLGDIFLLFTIFYIINLKLNKDILPIIDGIKNISDGDTSIVTESSLFPELCDTINKTTHLMKARQTALRKKETARANWISGVSHDIRTPLSIIMGYASQLENSLHGKEKEAAMAAAIVTHSLQIKNLVQDLNLASKLEYNMQPLSLSDIAVLPFMRQTIANFINLQILDIYPVSLINDNFNSSLHLNGDPRLISRAIQNLLQNSIVHNPNGCTITIQLKSTVQELQIIIRDNGKGITKDDYDKLIHTPHYLICDNEVICQRHGLGLLIVQQIMDVHHGTFTISPVFEQGFETILTFPIK